MTAISFLWRFEPGQNVREDGGRMLSALQPFGADHQALWSDGPAAMGRALRRTLPEDRHDAQPLAIAGGAQVLVADIRLDNRDELANALGITAAALSDADILARAWERWGGDCVPRLLGDFAFIVWDSANQRVFCARDALGRRPLYHHRGAGFLAIASMPKGLLALPDVPKAVDEELMGAFLAALPLAGEGNPFGDRSFHNGIDRLPPASVLVATRDHVKIDRYWDADNTKPVRFKRDDDYVERARELFDQAVGARLRSSGPVASQISAGLDSSTVTVTAARLLAARNEKLLAFTAVPRAGHPPAPKGKMADEGPLAAKAVSRLSNVEHLLTPYPLVSAMQAIEGNAFAADAPVLNACNKAWSDEIGRRAAQRGVRVMLCAPMGNATISYVGREQIHQLLRSGRLAAWMREVFLIARKDRPLSAALKRAALLSLPQQARHDLFATLGRRGTDLGRHTALSPAFIEDRQLKEREGRLRAWSERRVGRGWRARMIDFVDPGTIVAGAVAQFGFELRDPTSDRRLVEFCLGLPLDQFYRDGEPRRLVRRMMRGALPSEILESEGEGYQGVGWLENIKLAQDDILAEIQSMRASATGSRILDLDGLEALAKTIPTEGSDNPQVIVRYRQKLLRGVGAARFIRYVEGGNG